MVRNLSRARMPCSSYEPSSPALITSEFYFLSMNSKLQSYDTGNKGNRYQTPPPFKV